MADPKSPSRGVLAKFLSDHESIKKFERLFEVAGDLTPTDVAILYRLTQEASTEGTTASARSVQALDLLSRVSHSLEMLAHAPAPQAIVAPSDAPPPSRFPGVSELNDASVKLPVAGSTLVYDFTLKQWKNAVLTPGANITVTNADGSITLAVSGTLPTTVGGTGLTSFTANGIVRASSTSALTTASTFAYDGTTLSVGRTPLAWGGSFSVFDGAGYNISSDGSLSNTADFASNAYRTSAGAWSYGATNTATRYEQKSGGHTWYSAPSGTINTAVTWTNEMTISLGHNWSLGETATNLFYTGASHVISTRNSVTTGTKLLEIGVGAVVPGVAFFFGNNSSAPNTADSTMKIGLMGLTSRSINAAGTINAAGLDYAEYMRKAYDFESKKGDIIGISKDGELTPVFKDAVSFAVKSTNPSYVGGDTWGNVTAVGRAPDEPVRRTDVFDTVVVCEAKPQVVDEQGEVLKEATEAVLEDKLITAGETDDEWSARCAVYDKEKSEFDARLEAERQKVDRIAFAGQVPVNVQSATPGQYIIPVDDDGAISGISVSGPTFEQYMLAVGKVIAIESDGRPRIIVKTS